MIITVTGSSSSNTATAKTLLVDQSLTLKVSGKRIVAATLEDDNGTITVNNSGKVTALAAGTDTVLLITSDNAVRRVKITVNARGGRISISRNSKLRLRSSRAAAPPLRISGVATRSPSWPLGQLLQGQGHHRRQELHRLCRPGLCEKEPTTRGGSGKQPKQKGRGNRSPGLFFERQSGRPGVFRGLSPCGSIKLTA